MMKKIQLIIFAISLSLLFGCASETVRPSTEKNKMNLSEDFDKHSDTVQEEVKTTEAEGVTEESAAITAPTTAAEMTVAVSEPQETATAALICSTDYFEITLPDDWAGNYDLKSSDSSLAFYHTGSVEAGYGGYLFTVALEVDASDYDYLPSYQFMGYLSVAQTRYHVVAYLPSDVQFGEDFTSNVATQYMAMSDRISSILETLIPLNGATFEKADGSDQPSWDDEEIILKDSLVGEWWGRGAMLPDYTFNYDDTCSWRFETEDLGTYNISSDKTLSVRLPWSTKHYKWSSSPIETYKANRDQNYWCITEEGILILNDTKYYKDNKVVFESHDSSLLEILVGTWTDKYEMGEYRILADGTYEHNMVTVSPVGVAVCRHQLQCGTWQVIDETYVKLWDERGLSHWDLRYDAETDSIYVGSSDDLFVRATYE